MFSLGKVFKFRVTYVSEIRKTKIGEVLSFHVIDETGEVSVITSGQSCVSIGNFLKV